MMEKIYRASDTWFLLDKVADLAQALVPLIHLLILLFLFFVFQKRVWYWAMAVGSFFIVLSRVSPLIWKDINFITLPAPQPLEGQNSLVLIIYLHGHNFGSLLFVIGVLCLLVTHFRKKSNSPIS